MPRHRLEPDDDADDTATYHPLTTSSWYGRGGDSVDGSAARLSRASLGDYEQNHALFAIRD